MKLIFKRKLDILVLNTFYILSITIVILVLGEATSYSLPESLPFL